MDTHTRFKAIIPLALAILVLTMTAAAVAAPEGEVAAQVSTLEYSITIDSGGSLSYGMLDYGSSGAPDFGEPVLITNTGTHAAVILVRGENAQNDEGNVWTLGNVAGPNQYAWSLTSLQEPVRTVQVGMEPRVAVDLLGPSEAASFSSVLAMPISSDYPGDFRWTGYIYATAPVSY